jgi:hypothetical protein
VAAVVVVAGAVEAARRHPWAAAAKVVAVAARVVRVELYSTLM